MDDVIACDRDTADASGTLIDDKPYRIHLFFCTNQRMPKTKSCGGSGAERLYLYAKRKSRDLTQASAGPLRVNSAGCLGRCDKGPCVLVYPHGEWHKVTTTEDIDDLFRHYGIDPD